LQLESFIILMKRVCDYKLCTGCGLCAVECPKKSIKMVIHGRLGHVYPVIDHQNCIDCKICQTKCPALNRPNKERAIKAYAAWSKDEVDYKTSSSGGAASVFTNYVISNGGVVYGCAMLPGIQVHHIRVDNINDARKLKGSKYVQSNIVDIIPQIKEDVRTGRQVLFIGTPCQVAAIRSLYKLQPPNLLLVDLVCHGVPSQKLLQNHIKDVASSSYGTISFREGNEYLLVVRDEKAGEVYRKTLFHPRYREWYLNTFFDGYICRDSCYRCNYACPERISDITIGDFWGLGTQISAAEIPPHPNGCSLILPISDRGMQFVTSVSAMLNLYERNVDEAVEGNDQLKKPSVLGRRKKLFKLFFPVFGRIAYYVVNIDKIVRYQVYLIKMSLKK